ncbi:hypothetical protein LCGC14_0474190 [marine sediment metagenome]|uniref:Uncharacterized protein n=1 Tax=marine sediment metagenome TaxID=412755 RepID=A0A0F9SGE8_9ZZZZ
MKCEHDYLYQRPCRLCLLDTVKELEQENKNLAAHQGQYPAGDEFGNAYCTRIKELETVLKLVQRWGKDSRSVGAWEVFQEVAKALEPVPEQPVTVVDCTCIPCVCPGKERWNKGGPCSGCGARTCLAHELALKTSSRPWQGAKSRQGPE